MPVVASYTLSNGKMFTPTIGQSAILGQTVRHFAFQVFRWIPVLLRLLFFALK